MTNPFSSECYPLCVVDSFGATNRLFYCDDLVFRAPPYGTNYYSFSQKYDLSRGSGCTEWLYRKVVAIPAALWTGVVKAIYHLARSIFSLMDVCGAHCFEDAKIHLFCVVRDVQEALGCLIFLIDSKWGLYLIEDSRAQKSYYDSHIAARDIASNVRGAVIHDAMAFQLAERLIEASQWSEAKCAALAMRCADGVFTKRDELFVRLAEASLTRSDAEEAFAVISQIRQRPAQKEALFRKLGRLSITSRLTPPENSSPLTMAASAPWDPSRYWQRDPENKLRIAINSVRTIPNTNERNEQLKRVFEISLTHCPELAMEIILEVNDNAIRDTLYATLAGNCLSVAVFTRYDARWTRAKAAVLAMRCDNGDYSIKGRWLVRLVKSSLENYISADALEMLGAIRAIPNATQREELLKQLFTFCVDTSRYPFATTIILGYPDSAVRDGLYAKLSETHLRKREHEAAKKAILSMECADGNFAEKESLLLKLADQYWVAKRPETASEVLDHVRPSAQTDAFHIRIFHSLIDQFSEKLSDRYESGEYQGDKRGLYKRMIALMGDTMDGGKQLNDLNIMNALSKVSKADDRDKLLNKLLDICMSYNHYHFAQIVLLKLTDEYRFTNWDRLLTQLTDSYTKTAKDSWEQHDIYFKHRNYYQYFGGQYLMGWMSHDRATQMADNCKANFMWAGTNACLAALKSIEQIKDSTKAKSLLEGLLKTCDRSGKTEFVQEIQSRLLNLSKGPSPYQILGISQTASKTEIKKAYHKLAVQLHPDKAEDKSKEGLKKQEEAFKKISAAFATLIPPPEKPLNR